MNLKVTALTALVAGAPAGMAFYLVDKIAQNTMIAGLVSAVAFVLIAVMARQRIAERLGIAPDSAKKRPAAALPAAAMAAANGGGAGPDGEDMRPSNTGLKVLVGLVFLFSVCLAVLSAVLRVQSQVQYLELVRPAGAALPESPVPSDYVDYERAMIADAMVPKLRQYNRDRASGQTFYDEKDAKRRIGTTITQIIEKLSITGEYRIGAPSSPRPYRDDNKWNEIRLTVEFEDINRERFVKFMVMVEDEHPFLNVREFRIRRGKTEDSPPDHTTIGPDKWEAQATMVWFEKRPPRR